MHSHSSLGPCRRRRPAWVAAIVLAWGAGVGITGGSTLAATYATEPGDPALQLARLQLESGAIAELLNAFSPMVSPLAREVLLGDEALWSAYLADMATIYRSEFTPAELGDLLRFMDSGTGRKWLNRSAAMGQAMMAGQGTRRLSSAGCTESFLNEFVRGVQSAASQQGRSVPDDELRSLLRDGVAPKVRPTCECVMNAIFDRHGAEAMMRPDFMATVEAEAAKLLQDGTCPAPDFGG